MRSLVLLLTLVAAFDIASDAHAARAREAIGADIAAAMGQVRGFVSSSDVLLDGQRRAQVGPAATAAMRRAVAALDELAAADPALAERLAVLRMDLLSKLVLLGDDSALHRLEEQANSGGGKDATAVAARTALIRAAWWRAGNDPAAQRQVIDQARALMKKHARNDPLAMDLFELSTIGAANRQSREAMEQVVIDHAKGLRSTALIEQIEGIRRPRRLEGKPLVIKGTTLDGEPFDSSQWKGKVVLVYFWATWSPPSCEALLPRLDVVYGKYHGRGLEIVGVNNDHSAKAVREFLAKHEKARWPQLFDSKSPEIHPLAIRYGMEQLPTVFLIDRNGIVRTVEGREGFEKLAEELVADSRTSQ